MKKYALTIAVVIVAAGLFIYVTKIDKKPDDKAKIGKSVIVNFDRKDAKAVDINIGGEVIALAKNGKEWMLTRPEPVRTNKPAVDNLLFILSEYQADSLIEKDVPDIKKYGLDRPRAVVTVRLKSGGTREIIVGDKTPVEDASYVMVAGERKVYQVNEMNIEPFMAGLDAFRDRSIAEIDTDAATKIEVRGASGAKAACNRVKGGKWVFSGTKKKCDKAASSVFNSVQYTEAEQLLPSGADLSRIGLRPPRASVMITTPDEVTTLNIGIDFPQDLVYVENEERKEVYLSPKMFLETADSFVSTK